MPYVVTKDCRLCKFTDCVAVCPVDCFYEGEEQLVIDPDECIDCGACLPECPVEAIYEEVDLPENHAESTEFNLLEATKLKDQGKEPIIDQKDPLPTAEKRKAELGF